MATETADVGGKPEAPTLREQEYLSIKHALPKTRISHAILHENTSQDRHLNMKLGSISHRRNKISNIFDQNKRNFIETQLRKNRKWKSQDEMGAATMNFTYLRPDASRRPSMIVLYKSPNYYEKEEDAIKEAGIIDGKLLPYMNIRRERTEILQHYSNTYTTKLPTVIQQSDKKLEKYKTFCGIDRDMNVKGAAVQDERFTNMVQSLAPKVKGEVKWFLPEGSDGDLTPSYSNRTTPNDYGFMGSRKPNRFDRDKPAVVFPTLRAGAGDTGAAQSDSRPDGRFDSPTLRKGFGVRSGKAR